MYDIYCILYNAIYILLLFDEHYAHNFAALFTLYMYVVRSLDRQNVINFSFSFNQLPLSCKNSPSLQVSNAT